MIVKLESSRRFVYSFLKERLRRGRDEDRAEAAADDGDDHHEEEEDRHR